MRIAIVGIEATQAAQYFWSTFPLCGTTTLPVPCADNGIPLVAGKHTAIRAYLEGTAGDPASGLASYTDAVGVRHTLSPVNAAWLPSGRPDRNIPEHALTFLIPGQDAAEGVVNLDVTAWIQTIRPNPPSVSASMPVAFSARRRLYIRLLRVGYASPTNSITPPTLTDFWQLTGFLRSVFPIGASRLNLIGDSAATYDGDKAHFFGNDAPGVAGAATSGGVGHMLNQLALAEGLAPDVVYMALYPLSLYSSLIVSGFSGVGGGHRCIICADPAATPTFAHEVGHALGLAHAPAGGADGPDPAYPAYGALPSGSIGETGIDAATGGIFDPATTYDFMSYAGPPWISPYHYNRLRTAIGPEPPFPPPSGSIVDEVLRVAIERWLDGHVVVKLPGFVTPGPRPPLRETGEFIIELQDGLDQVLARTALDLDPVDEGPTENRWPDRTVALPWHDAARTLRIVRDGAPAFEYRIESAAPRVDVTFPSGDTLESAARLRWQPRTRRSQVLLRASADGKLWHGIPVPPGKRDVRIDLSVLPPGDRCCFELLVSAGLRTCIIRSPWYHVEPRPCHVLVVSPRPQVARAKGPIELVGAVTGTADPDDLVWVSSLDGEIGRGPCVLASGLSVGRHRIGLHLRQPDERSKYVTVVVSAPWRSRPKRGV